MVHLSAGWRPALERARWKRTARFSIELIRRAGPWQVIVGCPLPFRQCLAHLIERGRMSSIACQVVQLMRIAFRIVEFFFGPRFDEASELRWRKLTRVPQSAHGLKGRATHGISRRRRR